MSGHGQFQADREAVGPARVGLHIDPLPEKEYLTDSGHKLGLRRGG